MFHNLFQHKSRKSLFDFFYLFPGEIPVFEPVDGYQGLHHLLVQSGAFHQYDVSYFCVDLFYESQQNIEIYRNNRRLIRGTLSFPQKSPLFILLFLVSFMKLKNTKKMLIQFYFNSSARSFI